MGSGISNVTVAPRPVLSTRSSTVELVGGADSSCAMPLMRIEVPAAHRVLNWSPLIHSTPVPKVLHVPDFGVSDTGNGWKQTVLNGSFAKTAAFVRLCV